MQDCELDVGLNGQPDFAAADVTTQASEPSQTTASTSPQPGQSPQPTQNAGGFSIGGPSTTVRITTAGGTEALHFTGQAGQVVFVNVPSTTLPAGCGSLELEGPTGIELNDGCISGNGTGFVPATLLKASGTYTIVVAPGGIDTGSVVLKLILDHDQNAPITVGGPPVTATIAIPGEVSSFTFQGTAGETVTVQATDTQLDGCGDLLLVGPNVADVQDGCLDNGAGSIPETKLPTTGQYTIQVDPGGTTTGSAVVRLTSG